MRILNENENERERERDHLIAHHTLLLLFFFFFFFAQQAEIFSIVLRWSLRYYTPPKQNEPMQHVEKKGQSISCLLLMSLCLPLSPSFSV